MNTRLHKSAAIVLAAIIMFCCIPVPFLVSGDASNYQLIPVGNKEGSEVNMNYESSDALISEMTKMASRNGYDMYIDQKNLVMAVKDTANGELYFSNPYDAATDPYYVGSIRKALDSQIVLTYMDNTGKSNTLWSSTDCVLYGQYEIKSIENGLAVTYSIGEEKTRLLVPEKISKENFEKVLAVFANDTRAVSKLKILYKETTTDNGKDIYASKDLSDNEKSLVSTYFEAAGYTYEQLDEDNKTYDVTESVSAFPNFQIVVEYTLTDCGLQVNIPTDKFYYDTNNFCIVSMDVLQYFGAVDASKDAEKKNGYIFLPDGSGTIINFQDTTENRQALVSGQVYGFDSSITYPDEVRTGSQFYLPVFGMKRDDAGYFAVITEGSGMSTISGYAGNQLGEYFTAFASFAYTTREEMKMEQQVVSLNSTSIAYLHDKNVYSGNYTVQYTFLSKDNASYMGMSNIYQKYLIEQGMTKIDSAANTSLSIETLGTLEYTDKFLGVPYTADAKLTTFNQNQEILKYFLDNGISNLSLVLQAWRNGGIDATVVNRLDTSSALGGKSDFIALGKWCAENDIGFYPNENLVYVAKDTLFDGFNSVTDTARMMNKKYACWMTARPDTSKYDETTFQNALKPQLYSKYLNKFLNSYDKTGLTSFGLGTIGERLNSNFKDDSLINREENLVQIKEMLSQASKSHKLMVDGGNAYTLPYADLVNGIPMASSGYRGTTSIPFMQLVLNGVIGYSSKAINYATDVNNAILQCIESKTSPDYILAMDNVLKIKLTNHTEYYSVDSKYWLEEAVVGYTRYNKALEATNGATITAHDIVDSGVVKVTYSNGVQVYVNYNNADYTDGVVTVPAKDSLTIGG